MVKVLTCFDPPGGNLLSRSAALIALLAIGSFAGPVLALAFTESKTAGAPLSSEVQPINAELAVEVGGSHENRSSRPLTSFGYLLLATV